MKLLLVPCLSLCLPLSLIAEGGLPNEPYLYVEGVAEFEKLAEVATLQFEIVAQNPDQEKANQEVQAKAARILEMLNERNIAERDVVAQDVRSGPVYEDEDNGRRSKIIGYSVTRSFEAKLRALSALPKLVDDLLAISGLQFTRIDSGLADEKEVYAELSVKALSNARENAEKTLKALGMKIDRVFAVSPVSVPEARDRMTKRGEHVVITGSYIPAEPKLDAKLYRLASVTRGQSVHVIYLISPAK